MLRVIILALFLTGCSSKFFQLKGSKKSLEVEEYKEMIHVDNYEEPSQKGVDSGLKTEKSKEKSSSANVKTSLVKKKPSTTKSTQKILITKKAKKEVVVSSKKPDKESMKKNEKQIEKPQQVQEEAKKEVRQPPYEDSEGFAGRRPIKDPFRVGEKVRFAMTYFNVAAGYLDIEVLPFKKVNGRKAYHFKISAKSSKLFSYFYSVDDYAETFVDYETLRPYNLSVHVKESKQLKEIRAVHDWEKGEGYYWEKKVTKEKGEQKKSKKWKIGSYTQNVISAAFYVRTFQMSPQKKLAFQVADEGKNLMFKGTVLRKEKLRTDVGTLKTVVLKPSISIDGIFKPIGEVFFWFTDDDRKMIVRIESKIKIGTVVAKLKSLKK